MKYFYFAEDPKLNRASFAVTHPGQLFLCQENLDWLDTNALDKKAKEQKIDLEMEEAIRNQQLTAINKAHPRWQELTDQSPIQKPYRLNLVACGDVGSSVLIGLKLLAGDLIKEIGVFDIHPANSQRWEFELNQICGANAEDAAPQIKILEQKDIFACDIFVFCATAGVPPLTVKEDVRLLQYEQNAKIIDEYAFRARQAGFKGLFYVVSDPVDFLCQRALQTSNLDPDGNFDGQGLFPEQIEGFGLGVMHARAAYFARQDERFASYLTEGRAYGPHGKGLVIANSLVHYDDKLSQELTALAQNANLSARAADFKPYVAPAISSAVLPLLAMTQGQWHYSSTFLNGVFLGALNRRQNSGLELKAEPLPDQLKQRIEATDNLLRSRL